MARKNPPTTTQINPATTKTVQSAPEAVPPLKPVQISVTGQSNLTRILARRTNSRLKAFIDSDRKRFRNLKSVSGRIKILSVKEHWNEPDNALNVSINATMSGRIRSKDSIEYRFELEPVNSSGPDPVPLQLTKVATMLVESLEKVLDNPSTKGESKLEPDKLETTPPTDSINSKNGDKLVDKPDQGFE